MMFSKSKSIWRTGVFDDILYAQCWEDPAIDRQAFNIRPGDVILSITSGGCNVLAFLIDDPREVIALDINPYQNYMLDLKMAAFRSLRYHELLEFFGNVPSGNRASFYRRMRCGLSDDSRGYWDRQDDNIEKGILQCRRFEAYMSLLRKWIYRIKGEHLVRRLFYSCDPVIKAKIYAQEWDTTGWRHLTNLLLSRTVMTMLFDRAFFAQLDESFSFGEHFRRLVEGVLTDPAACENPFLSYILIGNYETPMALPLYLQPRYFHMIRTRLDRVRIIQKGCEEFLTTLPDDVIEKFNYTNIFEWMDLDSCERILKETVRVARNGSVVTYRNLLVPRSRPSSLASQIHPDHELARQLHAADRSFIYNTYIVERITKSYANSHDGPSGVFERGAEYGLPAAMGV